MPRKPAVIPSTRVEIQLPQDLAGRLTLELWSDVEGRVPYGRQSEFIAQRLREYFARARIDLAEVVPGLQPGIHFLVGERDTIELLRRHKEALCS